MQSLLLALLLAMPSAALATEASVSRVLAPRTAAQHAAFCSIQPEVCYAGRFFGGKTWIGGAKVWAYANLYPKARCLIFREERASMNTTTIPVVRDEIVGAEIWNALWNEGKSSLFLPNGSEIHLAGVDKPERILGSRWGIGFGDQAEQLTYRQFEMVNSRMMQVGLPWKQLFLAFNPEDEFHWAYKRYHPERGAHLVTDANGKTFAQVVVVGENDLLDLVTQEDRDRLERMSGTMRLRYRLGRWTRFEGAVLPWDPARHVVSRETAEQAWGDWNGYPPPDWPRAMGIDLGYEHPFACGWLCFDPDGNAQVYRQCYMTHRTPRVHAQEIVRLEAVELEALREAAKRRGGTVEKDHADYLEDLQIEGRFCDHARGERETIDEVLGDEGLRRTEPANKEIAAGLATLIEWLAPSEGRPRLTVVGGCLTERDPRLVAAEEPTCLEEEIPGYHYPTQREGVDMAQGKELPVDHRNHAIDWLRYALHSRATRRGVGVYG